MQDSLRRHYWRLLLTFGRRPWRSALDSNSASGARDCEQGSRCSCPACMIDAESRLSACRLGTCACSTARLTSEPRVPGGTDDHGDKGPGQSCARAHQCSCRFLSSTPFSRGDLLGAQSTFQALLNWCVSGLLASTCSLRADCSTVCWLRPDSNAATLSLLLTWLQLPLVYYQLLLRRVACD
jgi:hypothetical protein